MNESRIDGEAARATSSFLPAASERFALLVSLVLGCLLLLWFAAPTIVSLHPIWLEEYNYSHAYLVLGLTAWLVIREARLAPLEPFRQSWTGFSCLLVIALIMMASHASTTVLVAQAALPALLMAAFWAVAGARNARRFALPLGYLYFAIPIWDLLSEPLLGLTIRVVSAWAHAAGLPAFIEGNLIHLPSGTFEVAGGCTGLRYAIVASALSVLLGLFHHQRWAPSLLLASFAFGLALVANWLRVFILVWVGHVSEMQHYLIAHDHIAFGWMMFVVGMAPLFYLSSVLPSPSAAPPKAPRAAAGGDPSAHPRAVTYAAGATLALAIALNYKLMPVDEPLAGTVAFDAREIHGWDRIAEWRDVRRPQFHEATAEAASWYVDGAAPVGAYLAHYATQRQGSEVVFSQNRPEGQAGVVVGRRIVGAVAGTKLPTPFQELEIADSTGDRRLVWVGLRVAGKPATGSLAGKALQIHGAIRGRRDAEALILTTVCEGDCLAAESRLSRFATAATELLFDQAQHALESRQAAGDVGGEVL